jgi:hypothetical protein
VAGELHGEISREAIRAFNEDGADAIAGDLFEHSGEALPLCHRIRAAHRGVVELLHDVVARALPDGAKFFSKPVYPLSLLRSVTEPVCVRVGLACQMCKVEAIHLSTKRGDAP